VIAASIVGVSRAKSSSVSLPDGASRNAFGETDSIAIMEIFLRPSSFFPDDASFGATPHSSTGAWSKREERI
jgi:hypothetical protein